MINTPISSRTYTTSIGGKDITIETGKLAQQAGGAVTVRMGDTMLFCAATMAKHANTNMDFFPLTVEYEEKMYAGGQIPGGFLRREGRPSDRAILISRVIDRALRPLFPKNMRNEVQIFMLSLSSDQEVHVDMLGMIAASAALMISDIPWNGPVAGVRIGYIDGELVVNPTIPKMEDSAMNLRIGTTTDAINMVECNANEVEEEVVRRGMILAQESAKAILDLQKQMQAEVGKEKAEIGVVEYDEAIVAEAKQLAEAEVKQIVAEQTERDARNDAMAELRERIVAVFEERNESLPEDEQINLRDVREGITAVYKQAVRRRILDGVRPDGRDYTTIRPLSAEVGVIPRVHGSSLFQRGETQVLNISTLGTPRDSQLLDTLAPEDSKRYMHHYNFPPYSTGEAYRKGPPKRREIGHGTLAEIALLPMIPPEDEFPYTIRLVSEVMSSNGSTSMASVCASTLSLMDAGVPLKRPVAGIAMGLIKENDDVAVLTDIQGMEDHLGDMDFKVAGTANGITAIQMDIKIAGVTDAIMEKALNQARDARLEILGVMQQAISKPREELSDFAPRMISVKINPEKIGAVIGPGGKNIRAIQEETGAKIEIQEDGTVQIFAIEGPSVYLAKEKVLGMVEEPELGQTYTGQIKRIESFGVFVEILPGQDGLVHISQLADYRIEKIEDEFSIGDEIMVMVVNVDPSGKIRLSRQAVMEGWTLEEAQKRDRGGSRSSGNRNRNRSRGNDRRR